MKAKNIKITPDAVGFDVFYDDGTVYLNAQGSPVAHAMGGWLNRVPAEYTQADIERLIDDELYTVYRTVEADRALFAARSEKVNRIKDTPTPAEVVMTDVPELTIKTKSGQLKSPVTIDGTAYGAEALSYQVYNAAKDIVVSGTAAGLPAFSIVLTLPVDSYLIALEATNRRGGATASLEFSVK